MFKTPEEVNKELQQYLYEFADSATDRDGNVDPVGSNEFDIASKDALDKVNQIRINDIESDIEWLGNSLLSPDTYYAEQSQIDMYNWAVDKMLAHKRSQLEVLTANKSK